MGPQGVNIPLTCQLTVFRSRCKHRVAIAPVSALAAPAPGVDRRVKLFYARGLCADASRGESPAQAERLLGVQAPRRNSLYRGRYAQGVPQTPLAGRARP
jgi:hypothetical protein